MFRIWFTDDEKKLIRIVTNNDEDKAARLKSYLLSMQHVSVIGEEKEILEDIVHEILIKIKDLNDAELENVIRSI